MSRLRDQQLSDYTVADIKDLPVKARDRWVVLIDNDRPVSVIGPHTELDAGSPGPGIIVAPADLDLNVALSSEAFAEVADVSAVVLVEGEAIMGVWCGPSLANAVMLGPTRSISGPVLPGPPTIPLIIRSCTFAENGALCGTSSSFVSKPYPMPTCPNPLHLSAHSFHW